MTVPDESSMPGERAAEVLYAVTPIAENADTTTNASTENKNHVALLNVRIDFISSSLLTVYTPPRQVIVLSGAAEPS